MRNKEMIIKFQFFSIIFTIILGTLLHFTYEWSNNNVIVGTFSAVNESTWEHLKLLFFPMLITTIIGYFYIGRDTFNYLCSRLIGIMVAMLFVVVFFYTYTGIIGTNFAVLDIGSFFVAVLLGEYVSNKILNSNLMCTKLVSVIILSVILLCFIIFTFITPKIALFEDPITGGFGVSNER